MSWQIILGFVSTAIALTAIIVPIVRSRSRISLLEKLTPLITELDEGTAARRSLRSVRDKLALELAILIETPRYPIVLMFGLQLLGVAIALVVAAFFSPKPGDAEVVLLAAFIAFVIAYALLIIRVAFRLRYMRRRWRDVVGYRHPTWDYSPFSLVQLGRRANRSSH